MSNDDFLLTYNPECLERHSDSSDFDDNETLRDEGKNHSVLRRKFFRHTAMNLEREGRSKKRYRNGFIKAECNKNHGIHPRHCTCKECVIPVVQKQNGTMRRANNYGDNEQNVKANLSRLSVVRSKIIPCLSSIFGRGKDKHLVINSTKDNCCQVYSVSCNHKQPRQPNKHNYAVRSIHSADNGLDNTPDSGINFDSSHEKNAALRDSCISCDFTTSSISTNIQTAKAKFRKMVKREIRKAYLKRQHIKRTQEQQFPSKPNFHIFSSMKANKYKHNFDIDNDLRDISNFGCNVMPSNSSVFWEYLVDKINRKYQNNNRGGMIKSCHCTNTQKCPNMEPLNVECENSGAKTNEQATQGSVSCFCKPTPQSTPSPVGSQRAGQCSMCKHDTQVTQDSQDLPPKESQEIQTKSSHELPKKEGRETPTKRKVKREPQPPKVQCKCAQTPKPRKSPATSPLGQSPPSTPQPEDNNRPCQEPHDQIKETLAKKYNGEILCIHNPPCILINGCLNLPPVKGQFSPSAWPVTQRASFHCGYHKSDIPKQNHEQGCQYQVPDQKLYPVVEYTKTEKMTQSICNHDPPCEVVRCCYKPEFDPKLENSCVHVPMCQKLPKCIIDEANDSSKCEHQPKCTEMPVCKKEPKKYIVLTAKDTIGTQVRPLTKLECRHTPQCIMIPKCLGKIMCEGYVPYDAIPDCTHQPMCELIPACCRKSAKMVSECSQYPSPCRIV